MRRRIFCLAIAILGAASIGLAQGPLSADALQKLRDAAFLEQPEPLALDPRIVSVLNIADENAVIPSNRLSWLRPEGRQLMYFSLQDGTDDIVIAALKPGATSLYLTSSTLVLRAAAVLEPTAGHAVPLAQAASGFAEALKVWAAAAASLK